MCKNCKDWKQVNDDLGFCPFVLGGGGHTRANEGKDCNRT